MSFIDRVSEDLSNVYHCYGNAQRLNPENESALSSICFYPGIFEVVMLGLIPYNTAEGLYRIGNGTIYWDEFTPAILGPIHAVKYSPILITAITALAASHSKKALATLAGLYVIKKLVT